MSGNGNNESDSSSTPWSNINDINCSAFSGRGTIMSPSAAVLATLAVGDILNINLRTAAAVQAWTQARQLVGTVFFTNDVSLPLIHCLNEQFTYQARITSLVGGSCELLIYSV